MHNENKNECGCNVKHIKGVTCDVSNCVHHDSQNCCTAGEINVGPHYAQTGSETVCATFKPKDID